MSPEVSTLSRTERPKITVGSLFGDNRSEWAEEARTIWRATRAEGNLTLVAKCGDSRTVLPNPDTVIDLNIIATGEPPPRPLEYILQSPGVRKAVVMGHFDGETAGVGKMPRGCGGLRAKEDQLKNPEIESNLDYYISNNIYHPDPIVQSLITGTGMLEYSDRPILVAAQNHRTGEIFPIAVIHSWGNKGAIVAQKAVLTSLRHGGRYDPERFYENGMPVLDETDLTSEFIQFLSDSREKMKRLKDKFPDLYETSRVQDPLLIDFSTRSMPFATCFPETGERPGMAFGVFVSPEELITSTCQIEYPISQSLKNHGQKGKPFASTNTILIDTEDFTVSDILACKLIAESRVVKDWASIKGHKIIISATTDGVTTEIEEFKPNI